MSTVILRSTDSTDQNLTISALNWRRMIHLAQWGGWLAPLDHWDFAADAHSAGSFADGLAAALTEIGEPPRGAAEVAVDILPGLGLDDVNALKLPPLQGLALFEMRTHLRDFFVHDYDGLRMAAESVTDLARRGGFQVRFGG